MKISVIISYYQRKDNCLRVVKALESQTDRDFEIVVADDGSDVPIKEHLPEGVIYCRQKHLFYSPGRTRNFGASHATGDMYLFLDQDCVPGKEVVKNIKQIFNNVDYRPLVLAGYIENYAKSPKDPRTPFGIWDNHGALTRSWGHISGGIFCIDSDSFWKSGGCEGRELKSYDDVIFGFRLIKAVPDIKIMFCDNVRCFHLDHPMDSQRSSYEGQFKEFIKAYYTELYQTHYPKESDNAKTTN